MPEVITIGESMAVMTPGEPGPLRYVADYRLRMAGAESNLAVGLCKLGHTAGWISRLGEDEIFLHCGRDDAPSRYYRILPNQR